MNYYVLQVKTGFESKYQRLVAERLAEQDSELYWPRRTLKIRKKGKTKDVETALFPGYLILGAERLSEATHWILRRTNGFFRFLPDNQRAEPLSGSDLELIRHFLSFGEVLEKSRVYFDENKRIRVVHGALKGLEGKIVKVDKRKQRAKVELSLYEDSFLIDFGFELIEPAEEDENSKT